MPSLQEELKRALRTGYEPPPFGGVTITKAAPQSHTYEALPESDPKLKPIRRAPKTAAHRQWAEHDVDQGPEHGTRYRTRGTPGFIKNVRGAYYVYVGKMIVGKFTSYDMAAERLTRVRTSA